MSITVVCEECDKQIQVRDELEGKRIRCPKCKSPILVEEAEFEELEEEPSPPRAKRRRRPAPDSDHEEEAPRRSRPRPKPKKKSSSKMGLWLGIGGGVAVLLIVGVVLALVFFTGNRIVGKWREAGGSETNTIEFKIDGTVVVTSRGKALEGTYEMEGDQLSITIAVGGRSETKKATVTFEDSDTVILRSDNGATTTIKRE